MPPGPDAVVPDIPTTNKIDMEYRLVWFHELREYCDRYRDGSVAKLISTALRTTI